MLRAAMKLTSTVKKSNGPGAVDKRQRLPVHALEVGDARVALQRRVELALAHVDGGDVGGAVRQQRLGEAARRGADIDRARAAQACREAEALDGGLELEPAATDPTAALALH